MKAAFVMNRVDWFWNLLYLIHQCEAIGFVASVYVCVGIVPLHPKALREGITWAVKWLGVLDFLTVTERDIELTI